MPGEPLNRLTDPPFPTVATTKFGIVKPGVKFRFDAVGKPPPVGYAVMNPAADGPVTVTFSTTAPTPDAGTPPCPATSSTTVPDGATAPTGAPVPTRVSNNRAGTNGPYAPADTGSPERKYPATSATR